MILTRGYNGTYAIVSGINQWTGKLQVHVSQRTSDDEENNSVYYKTIAKDFKNVKEAENWIDWHTGINSLPGKEKNTISILIYEHNGH